MPETLTLKQLLEKYEKNLASAFLAAIRDIADNAQIGRIASALESGDVQAAVDAIYVDRAAFAKFEALIEQAYGDGGLAAVEELGQLREPDGGKLIFRFGARNFRAEQWLRQFSSQLVTGIVEDQKIALQTALTEGLQRGDNPRRTALDVVGRISKQTGRREGGILGLSAPQERALARAREELASGDFSAYRGRKLRDKRFDKLLDRLEREGKTPTKAQSEKILGRYSDRLLKFRGDTIGRTETLASLNAAQYEALQQLVDTGKVQASQIRRTWDSAGDFRVRFSHMKMDGDTVGFDERFKTPSGRLMLYPGDPAGGAAETINCRCVLRTVISYRPNR